MICLPGENGMRMPLSVCKFVSVTVGDCVGVFVGEFCVVLMFCVDFIIKGLGSMTRASLFKAERFIAAGVSTLSN